MRFLVASESDEASRNQRDALLELEGWTEEEPFEGRPSWRFRESVLVGIAQHHLFRDHLDRDLETAYEERVDVVIYLSKHRSESRRASLTVHPIGNPGEADFGGQPETLVPSAPRLMTSALRSLRSEAKALAYEVTLEATHHGPYLVAPTFFIEQGSTEAEWRDRDASRAIARVLQRLRPSDDPIGIGIGGGHYVPRHTDLAFSRRIAFGHLLASHAIERAPLERIEQALDRTEGASLAYVHRKSLSKPDVRAIEERLSSLGIRVVREADLERANRDET